MAQKKLLEKQEVVDVIEFAQNLWAAEKYGLYTPWLQNQLLNNLNNNPRIPDYKSIVEALSSYKESAKNLQDYMEFMQKFDMIFARTLMSYVNVLSFDLTITCKNAFTQADYQSAEYAEDKKRIYKFLDNFDYKAEFRKMLQEMLRHEVVYTWFRKTKWGNKGMKCALQILPQNRCMLTGYWEKGMLFDFDMNYFLQPGVDIDGFDPEFKKYYNNVFGTTENPWRYVPTNPLSSHDGTFAMWTQTSPDSGAWVWKFDMSNFNTTPYLAPFLKDAIRNDEVATLQYNKDIASAYGILAGEIKTFDNAKSGTVANQFTIDPALIGVLMGKVKQGLQGIGPNGDSTSTTKAVAMPTENIKWFQFSDSNPTMYEQQLANSAGVGSGISRVIYSSDRMSNAEIEAGIIDQYNTVKQVYSQFNNFLEFFGNQLTKRYKFKFSFDGCSYPFEREKRFERLTKAADKGIVLGPSAWASAMGYTPMEFDRLLDEAKYGDFSTKWQLMLNTNTTAQDSQGGRPQKDTGDLTDSGESSRDGINGL